MKPHPSLSYQVTVTKFPSATSTVPQAFYAKKAHDIQDS